MPSVAQKIQEQLDSEEGVIITDSKGQELLDGIGTQGIGLYNIFFFYVLLSWIISTAKYLSDRTG